jgi:16S rRNA (cytosine967-C5)-methyltransferase
LHGFVNGVLRESIRQRLNLPQPEDAFDSDGLPVLNHPDWLTTRWQRHFGREEMLTICRQNNRQQPLSLRVNTMRINRQEFLARLANDDIDACRGNYSADAVILRQYHGPITALPGYSEGQFQVQDESAQLVSLLLQPFHPGGDYVDACAGLGGKTGHLLQLLQGSGSQLTAIEPESHRQDKLVENLQLLFPSSAYSLYRGSLLQFLQTSSRQCHGVLVDAPCTGTGVTGRHPDIRWRRSPLDLVNYPKTQTDLLQQASTLLLPGGILVYATCSLEPEENEDVVDLFLSRNQNFSLTDCAPLLPASAAPLLKKGCFQPHPGQGVDGFFAARLMRTS